jgi:hypothetical protein
MHISSLLYTYHTRVCHRQSIDFDVKDHSITLLNTSLSKRKKIYSTDSKINELLTYNTSLNPISVVFLLKCGRYLDIDNILKNKTESKLKYISNVCYQESKFIEPTLINESLYGNVYVFSKGLPLELYDVQYDFLIDEINSDKLFRSFYFYHRSDVKSSKHTKYNIKIAKEFLHLSNNLGLSTNLAVTYLKGLKDV